MERLPRRTPSAQMDIVGLLFDALEDIPVQVVGMALRALGDLVGEAPIVGDTLEAIIDGVADIMLQTKETAQQAQETAATANTTAGTALTEAAAAVTGIDDLTLRAALKLDLTNLSEVYDAEDATVRAKYPLVPGYFTYGNIGGLAHSGSYYTMLDPPDTGSENASAEVGARFRVTPGESIYLEWWARRSNNANYRTAPYLEYRDVDGAFLGSGFTPWLTSAAANNTWIKYTAIVAVPSLAADAQPRLFFEAAGSTTGQWLYDEIVVRRAVVDAQAPGLNARVTALEGGGTRTVYTATTIVSNPGYGTYGVAFMNGGQGGSNSIQDADPGPAGGTHGGYIFREFDCASLASQLAFVVGAGGAINGALGGVSGLGAWNGSSVTTWYQQGISGNIGSILTRQGAVASSSTPGAGGRGGAWSSSQPGSPGGSSALANGGNGGAGKSTPGGTAGSGTAGGSVSTSEAVPCGGGGGGGGGAGSTGTTVGAGGAGGAPGGGGGGAGAKLAGNTGNTGGPGGAGRLIAIWRPGAAT